MNYELNHEGFEKYLIVSKEHLDGIAYRFKFENNYGASVIKHRYSYGGDQDLWELAVIKFEADGSWDLNYDTEVTSDVLGYRTDADIRDLLEQIKNLDEPKNEET